MPHTNIRLMSIEIMLTSGYCVWNFFINCVVVNANSTYLNVKKIKKILYIIVLKSDFENLLCSNLSKIALEIKLIFQDKHRNLRFVDKSIMKRRKCKKF